MATNPRFPLFNPHICNSSAVSAQRRSLLGAGALLLSGLALAPASHGAPARGAVKTPPPYSGRPEVQRWAAECAAKNKLSRKWVLAQLAKARHSPESASIMSRPRLTAGRHPDDWLAHERSFVTEKRIAQGREFFRKHRRLLLSVERRWGVPAPVIASVIGIETSFGEHQGTFRAIDVLATLSFDYTRRAAFFRQELASLLVIGARTKTDPTAVRASFAGAVGLCQFMPSSILSYGVDYNRDGRVDLNRSVPDALASVANYLAKSGWVKGLPVAVACRVPENIGEKLVLGAMSPNTTFKKALAAGVRPLVPTNLAGSTPVFLVRLKSPAGDEWRLATANYAAILRYNRSYFYAESVRVLAVRLGLKESEQASDAQQRPVQSPKKSSSGDTPRSRVHADTNTPPRTGIRESVIIENRAPRTAPLPEPGAPNASVLPDASQGSAVVIPIDEPDVTLRPIRPSGAAQPAETVPRQWGRQLITPALEPERWN